MNIPTKLIVLLCIATSAVANKRLRIIHTNDMHSRFEEASQTSGMCSSDHCYGGFPRLLTAVNEQKAKADAEGIPWIFLNAGDTYQGTLYYTLYKWEIVAAFIDRLGLDAMSLGNHEFDDGIEGLAPYLKNISTPVVAANIDVSNEPSLQNTNLSPSTIIERGGLRIGVIGYITPETVTLSTVGNVVFKDEISSISAEVENLKKENVSIIIALGHSGYFRDQNIAGNVTGLHAVVGGHSHTFLYTGTAPDSDVALGPYPTIIEKPDGLVPVVQAYYYTKYLGVFDIELDDNNQVINANGNPILLDSSIQQDPQLLADLQPWKDGLANSSKEVIGETYVFLNGWCRFAECNLGNLLSDALVDYAIRSSSEKNWTQTAIAIYSSGSIRNSIQSVDGKIRREDVMLVLPYFNPVSVISIQGKYLLEALEWSVARYDPMQVVGKGEFLQMSGIHVTYNISNPVGSRVVRATVRCAVCQYPTYSPIDPSAEYNIVMASFLAEGGDNFTMIAEHGTVVTTLEQLDTDVLMDYIKRRNFIYDGEEERITVILPSKKKHTTRLFRKGYIRSVSKANKEVNSIFTALIIIPFIMWQNA